MEALNSKEKSKKLWQFILIFCLLALLPVATIFYSYFVMPEAIANNENQKLIEFSNFKKSQNIIIKNLSDIDSNFNLLASDNSNVPPASIFALITNENLQIKNADSSKLVSTINKLVDNYTKNMTILTKTKENLNHSNQKNEILDLKDRNLPQAPAPSPSAPANTEAPNANSF